MYADICSILLNTLNTFIVSFVYFCINLCILFDQVVGAFYDFMDTQRSQKEVQPSSTLQTTVLTAEEPKDSQSSGDDQITNNNDSSSVGFGKNECEQDEQSGKKARLE